MWLVMYFNPEIPQVDREWKGIETHHFGSLIYWLGSERHVFREVRPSCSSGQILQDGFFGLLE